ncbi:hypothetical protein C0992_006088 [Termitomyces sp. T32_za158]|nr:hypothetical protein C0992_006088 [Termitomyces sp. T32_za158]
MPIDLAIEKYVLFSQEVFSDVKKWSLGAEKFMATTFESSIKGILQSAGFPEDVMMQEDVDAAICKSFVVALPSANMTPRLFRTYKVMTNQGYDCTVVEAARATTATPDLFKSVFITSGGISEEFVGASFGYSNPTNLVLNEAVSVFGLSQPVASFVSIGAGHPGLVSWKSKNSLGKLLHHLATDCEGLAESFVKNHIQIPGLFYRLSVEQGLQNMALNNWIKIGNIKTHTLAYLEKAAIKQEVNNISNILQSCPQKSTLKALGGGTICINLFNEKSPSEFAQALLPIVPAPSPLFVGRKDILSDLDKFFKPQNSSLKMQMQQHYVLHGIGGAGKTQIALEFCHKFGSRFSSMYMINASSQASIEQFLTLLARSVKLINTTPAAALTWLCYQKAEWLIILDNADDPDIDLNDFFPDCNHGNIIITSRNEGSKMYSIENHQKIQEMTHEDSLAVFYKASHRKKDEQEDAKKLVQELGFLALAIVQAGSYLYYNQHIKVKQYLESYKKDMQRYLGGTRKQRIDKYQLSVFVTWDKSYQKLDEKAKAILMLCGVLNNSKIPLSIFERAWRNLSSTCEVNTQELQDFLGNFAIHDREWSDELLEEALEMLRSYSLIEIRGQGATLLDIHPLVHRWTFESLSSKEQKKAQQCAQQLFYCLGDGKLKYNDAAELVLHIRALMRYLNHKCENHNVAEALAQIFSIACFWSDMEQIQHQVLEECKKKVGCNHSDTIKAMYNLAETFWKNEKFKEAEKLNQEVLNVTRDFFGVSHPDTIAAMSKLAKIFLKNKKLEKAEKLQQDMLKASKEVFGTSHLDTIVAMSDLAITFQKSGKLEEAEQLQQEVLKICKEVFGTNNLQTLVAMSNLAITFMENGKQEEEEKVKQEGLKAWKELFKTSYPDTFRAMFFNKTLLDDKKLEKAIKQSQDKVKVMRKAFGINHLETRTAILNFAQLAKAGKKLENAEKLGQEMLKLYEEAFGASHLHTIQLMFDFATTCRKSEKLEEGDKLLQKALKIGKEVFGTSHQITIKTMYNLAVFWKSKRVKEAEKLLQEVLEIGREVFGTSHLVIYNAMSLLAEIYYEDGRLEEAEKLLQETLRVKIKVFGINHPDTIQVMSELAELFWKDEKLERAEMFQQEVLRIQKDAFGLDHPDTVVAMYKLIEIFWKSRKLKKAEVLQQEMLKLSKEAFGTSHSNTIIAMFDLAVIFREDGKLEEAEKLQQEVLKMKKKALTSYSDTMIAMSNIAAIFQKDYKPQKAEKLRQKVLNNWREAFGTSHPKTIHAMSHLAETFKEGGKLEKAEILEQEVVKLSKKAFGTSHPNTIQAMSKLAKTFRESKKLKEAEILQQKVLKIKKKTLGTNHPDTLIAISNLAAIFCKGGRLQEAEKLQQQVLNISKKAFETNHSKTIQAMSNLAETFKEGGKFKKAEKLQQEVLKVSKEAFGTSHPNTIQAMLNLAKIFQKDHKLQEAEKLQKEVLNIKKETSHPNTIEAM